VVKQGEVEFNILCKCFINIFSGDLDRHEGGLLWILWATTSSSSSLVEGHLLNGVRVLVCELPGFDLWPLLSSRHPTADDPDTMVQV
jgi:hypothetical protein